MRRLIWAFAGRTYHIVGNVISQLFCIPLMIIVNLDPDQAWQNVSPDFDSNCSTLWWYFWKNFVKYLLKNLADDHKKHALLPSMQRVEANCLVSLTYAWNGDGRIITQIWAVARDFRKCGILTSVDSDEPLQPPFMLRNSKWCSVSIAQQS